MSKAFPHPIQISGMGLYDLEKLAEEVRKYIIDTILQHGGHFAANLGVVELTVALLKQFDPISNPIIWDVGHQSYPFKVLTFRANDLPNIRSFNSISGFPKREESEFDAFGTGHSSTAISAAMGMAQAFKLDHNPAQVIAVVGDGALTGGISYEALNNLIQGNLNVLIVLNDNQMGIDPNTGALNHHLTNNHLNQIKAWFEWFGLDYHGPIDGHNLSEVLLQLENLKVKSGPKILHIKTVKGKGYLPAEKEQTKYHATNKYVKISPESSIQIKWQDVFGEILTKLSSRYLQLVGITPAMPSSCGMSAAIELYPDRFFDVGISEQHALTFAAGLATKGKIPIVNIYSTFLQRAYDQWIHDIALQKLPVILCIDRAGLVGEDGPTHHGAFDLSFLLPIPQTQIFAPRNAQELTSAIELAIHSKLPTAIRYPKGNCENPHFELGFTQYEPAVWINQHPSKHLVISFGTISLEVEKNLSGSNFKVDQLHISQIKPLPTVDLSNYSYVLTIEDGSLIGGAGQFMRNSIETEARWTHWGLTDEFISHGSNTQLFDSLGIGPSTLNQRIHQWYSTNSE